MGCADAVKNVADSAGVRFSVPPYDAGGTRFGSKVVR